MTASWYVWRCLPGASRLFAERFAQRPVEAVEVYQPIEQLRLCRRGAVRVLQRPLFGSYVFCHLDIQTPSYGLLKRFKGIDKIVQIGPNVLAVRDSEIADVRARENARGVIPAESVVNIFKRRDSVHVVDGLWTGYSGEVARTGKTSMEREDHRGVATLERVAVAFVNLAIFGRSTLVEIVESQLETA